MIIKKKIIFLALILVLIPLVFAGNYGKGIYGSGNYSNSSISSLSCGDGLCNNGESCLNCSTDCGTCPVTPSLGGGGTTTIIEKCVYNWDCTPWGLCADGKQTRVCKNIGTCEGNESKPVEEMQCSEALFDISLNLKNIELTENKTLKFNIGLAEKIGVEKIDVHIKYSIIDKDDKEIFSQIETKAVQGKLNFDKETEKVKLPEGKYTLRVDILYGNLQRAFAEQKFEIKKEGNGKEKTRLIIEKGNFNWMYLIYGIAGIFLVLLVLILIKFFKKFRIAKRKTVKTKTHKEYKSRIKQNLKKIRGRTFLMILAGFMLIGILSIEGKSMIGFVVESTNAINNPGGVFGFILILGMLGFLIFKYRKKIVEKIEVRRRNKSPKNSLKGLIKKKVYTEDGDFIGQIKEAILGENKIDSLKIRLDKKQKSKIKIIIVKYKDVKCVGHIVIINEKVLEKLDI